MSLQLTARPRLLGVTLGTILLAILAFVYWFTVAPADASGTVSLQSNGYYHSCASVEDGILCWGNNVQGQLGIGTNSGSLTPVKVTGIAGGVKAIAGGSYSTCAVTSA